MSRQMYFFQEYGAEDTNSSDISQGNYVGLQIGATDMRRHSHNHQQTNHEEKQEAKQNNFDCNEKTTDDGLSL